MKALKILSLLLAIGQALSLYMLFGYSNDKSLRVWFITSQTRREYVIVFILISAVIITAGTFVWRAPDVSFLLLAIGTLAARITELVYAYQNHVRIIPFEFLINCIPTALFIWGFLNVNKRKLKVRPRAIK